MRRTTTAAAIAGVALALTATVAGCSSDSSNTGSDHPVKVDTTSAPANLTWENWQGVELPQSTEDGPKGYAFPRMGYAHSPQGAVLAAIRGQAVLALASDQQWGGAVPVVTAPGPGRDAFAANRAMVSVKAPVPADKAPVFVGFKVTKYQQGDPSTAGVLVAEKLGNGLYSYPVALQWISNDWRIVLPTAAENIDAATLANLDGYTALKGAK